MKLRRVMSVLLAALLAFRLVPAALAAENEPYPAVLQLNTSQHIRFMDGQPDGLFHPQDSILRAEAAQIFYSLLVDPPQEGASYPDLDAGAWYAVPVGVLGAAGLLHTDGSGMIRPTEPITRAEFASMFSPFLHTDYSGPSFTDVPSSHWACEAITAATAWGIFSGYEDGTFRPDEELTRAETAAVVCRLLGRNADLSALSAAGTVSIFPDVSTDFWAYGPVMEAAVTHTHALGPDGMECWTQIEPRYTVLSDGFHSIDGYLYRVQNGLVVRSATVDGFTFDGNGRYTTGSAYLDERLAEIVRTYTNSSMTRDQKLRALYDYERDNYRYLKRNLVAKDETGWENAFAEEFLKTGVGNCFSYAAAYCLLARQLGLPAYTVVGQLSISTVQDHGWVEIPLDGNTYLFDVELEWSYRYRHNRAVDLFMVDPNHAPYTYIR